MLDRAEVKNKWKLTPLKNFKSPRLTERMWRTALVVLITSIIYEYPLEVKYGNTNGKHQEEESAALLEEFFKDSDLPKEFTDRVSYIVSHHHTIDGIDGIDYQIMIEADYLVNADESNFSGNNVRNMLEKVFKTETGKFLLKSMYQKRLDSAEEK